MLAAIAANPESIDPFVFGLTVFTLACVVGFWKFYNTVHDSLHIPVESELLNDTGYVSL